MKGGLKLDEQKKTSKNILPRIIALIAAVIIIVYLIYNTVRLITSPADTFVVENGTLDSAETVDAVPFDERGKIFKLPDGTTPSGKPKVMIVITETFKTKKEANAVTDLDSYQVVPLRFNEYIRLMSKPSSDPLKKQVWKLMGNSESGNGSIEIVPHWKDKNNATNKLVLKYIRKPYPIILEDLSSQGLTIEGYKGTGGSTTGTAVSGKACCELAEELHPEILQRAVELAKIFYQGEPTSIVTAGQRSE